MSPKTEHGVIDTGETEAAARRYINGMETLNPKTLDDFIALFAEDARFVDPFSDVRGRTAIHGVFEHMFRLIGQPNFTVDTAACDGCRWLLAWQFQITAEGKRRAYTFPGTSVIDFTPTGLVAQHIDHWDAGAHVYGRIPILGPVISLIRRRLGG